MAQDNALASQAADFLGIFYEIDKDKSGVIEKDELKKYIVSKGFSQKFVDKYLRVFDYDNDGKITFVEYRRGLERMPQAFASYKSWQCLFERLDRNRDGYITLPELQNVIKEAGSGGMIQLKVLQDFMMEMDVDGDGKLNYREFLEFLLRDKPNTAATK